MGLGWFSGPEYAIRMRGPRRPESGIAIGSAVESAPRARRRGADDRRFSDVMSDLWLQ